MTRIFTLGHSDRSLEDVLQLLRPHGVDVLVDVRRFPGSRKHPQWDQSEIRGALPANIDYTWIIELGGRRHTPAGIPSLNGAWRVKAFQDYADHMATEEFAHGLRRLVDLSERAQPAIMCSEAVPWRCHRRLIADALIVAGLEVEHIISRTSTQPATFTQHAQLRDGQLTYPAQSDIR